MQNGEQQQRPPFTQGQLLQGIISAKSSNNLFTINFEGLQVQAESTAPLQVGQELDLQVASLTPRVELQIISNPFNRRIGSAIHLIGQQQSILPDLAALAEKSEILPQLSTGAQEILQFYSRSLNSGFQGEPSPPPQTRLVWQLLNQTAKILALPPQSPDIVILSTKIGNLLQQLARNPAFPSETAELATSLAAIFNRMGDNQSLSALAPSAAMATATRAPEAINAEMLEQIGKPFDNEPNLQNLLDKLLPLLQENNTLAAARPLRQLVALLATLDNEQISRQTTQIDGRQLEKIVDRLGINMEHLLAQGSREEAVQTLKFSLLELSQQLAQADKSTTQVDRIVKSIELYQLLQIRMANESIFFMPLPFSFLNQGYLLIDPDHSRDDAESNDRRRNTSSKTYELHLQLRGLGNLKIDIRQENDQIAVRFLTEDVERAKFLAGFREELGLWLTATNLESVQYLVGSQEPVKALLEKIVHGVTGMVDTNA